MMTSQDQLETLFRHFMQSQFEQLTQSRQRSALSNLQSLKSNRCQQIESKVEFINEQKENLKILDQNLATNRLILDKLAILHYRKKTKQKAWTGLRNYFIFKKNSLVYEKIRIYMQRTRKKGIVFRKWRNESINKKKSRLGKEKVQKVKSEIFQFKEKHEDVICKLEMILQKKMEELAFKKNHLEKLEEKAALLI